MRDDEGTSTLDDDDEAGECVLEGEQSIEVIYPRGDKKAEEETQNI